MAYIDIAPGTTVQFGVDPKCGMDLKPHLMLSLVNDGGSKPVGSIKNLPGFAHPLEFQAIKQISNGEDIISFAPNSKKMRLYDVVDFLPYTINSYDDEFNIDGAIDYGIRWPQYPITSDSRKIQTKFGTWHKTMWFHAGGTFRSLMSRQDIESY